MDVSVSESVKEYKQTTSLFDKERRAEQMKAYYDKNREKLLAYGRNYYKKYYPKNSVKERERIARWKLANAERVKEYNRKRYQKLKLAKLRGESVKRRENGMGEQ